MKYVLLFLLIALTPMVAEAQAWVDSFGVRSPYQPPRYVSGYGVSELPRSNERLEAARNAALAQLSGQVRTTIKSTEEIRTTDTGTGQLSRYSNAIQTATDLQITGARFEIVQRSTATHVLAWVEVSAVRAQFLSTAADTRARLQVVMDDFDRFLHEGRTSVAEQRLREAEALIAQLHDATVVVRALDALAGARASTDTAPASAVEDPLALERLLRERRARFATFQPTTIDQAVHTLARTLTLSLPASRPGTIRIPPLLYQDADFSSSFGHRLSGLLESELIRSGAPGQRSNEVLVIRGSYGPGDTAIEIQLTARHGTTGRVLAAAVTTVPRSAVAADSLQPANLATAIAGGRALFTDAMVGGGIDVEVWTDRGRNESALVFEEEESIQFYFRVNQPAFLQLSYVLGTGETVLLEESFYIGIDRVNRVVELPYRFQVVPPFGVERFIVTAHSTSPPRPDVLPRQISGQVYEVFRSVGDAVVHTRGLVRERPSTGAAGSDIRVGEAHLSITTVARGR